MFRHLAYFFIFQILNRAKGDHNERVEKDYNPLGEALS